MNLARRRITVASLLLAGAIQTFLPMGVRAQEQKVVDITVRGNNYISSDIILKPVQSKPNTDVSDQQLEIDRGEIEKLGFFHEVLCKKEPDPGGGGVRIVFEVVEHPKVTSIEVTGNTKVPTKQLRDQMITQVGSVFNAAAFDTDVKKIERLYRDRGYLWAQVTQGAGVSPEGVVTIPVEEGRVGTIRVVGNKKTKTRIILREMDTKPGEVFNAKVLQEDLKRLMNLQYFDDRKLSIEPEAGPVPGTANLVVNTVDQKTGNVSVGLGYSSREKLVGFADVTEHNFRGVGQEIGVRWEAGQFTNRSGLEFSFNDPWMLGKRTSLGFQLYDRATNRPFVLGTSASDLWILESRKGAGVSVGKPVGLHNRLLLDFRSDDVTYSAASGYPEPPQDIKDSSGRVTSLTLRGIRNTRNLDINPSSGVLYSTSAELAGGPLGGRWTYSKLGADMRRYFPIGAASKDRSNQKVLAMRLMAGMSLGNLPLSENYWLGGAETLRGYREDQFHGTRVLLYSAEFRIPFGRTPDEGQAPVKNFQGVLFFDYGHAWKKSEGFNLGDMKPAAGVGLRVLTPLGPLRLDYAFGKEGGRSHFSIGHVF